MELPKCYKASWDRYFGKFDTLTCMKDIIIDEGFDSSIFRTLSWSVLLKCLPSDKNCWLTAIETCVREYNLIKEEHYCDPYLSDENWDIKLNNPLSQEENTPWNKYFSNRDIRNTIKTDVIRTFPEVLYFRKDTIQRQMVEILFYFAKENPNLLYKQGMHEILAPIVYIVRNESDLFHKLRLSRDFEEFLEEEIVLLSSVYCEDNIEALIYHLFVKVMEKIACWYVNMDDNYYENSKLHNVCEGESNICSKLTYILNPILNGIDHDLLIYFQNNTDLKEFYYLFGFRCLRLLFGREFRFHSLFCLWDVIFSMEINFIDFIMVSMLTEIRDSILDGIECDLLRYPDIDIQVVISKAQHYLTGKKNPKPLNMQMQVEKTKPRVAVKKRSTTDCQRLQLRGSKPMKLLIEEQPEVMKLRQLERKMMYCGSQMDLLVKKFGLLSDKAVASSCSRSLDLTILIAELKKIRDTLKGDLDTDHRKVNFVLPTNTHEVGEEVDEDFYEFVSPTEVLPSVRAMPLDGRLPAEEEMKIISKKS